MNLLLSALVLAWGMVPPGVQHAHSAGNDTTHRHGDGHEVAQRASHDHRGDGEDHEHAATVPDVWRLADYVLHLHWRFLGMEFSMPVSEEPADGDQRDRVSLATVLRVDQTVPATQAGPSFCRVLLAGICTPHADVVRTLTPVPRPPNLVTSIPLCDSARLERSGVLLA